MTDNDINAIIPTDTQDSVSIRKIRFQRTRRERERDLALIASLYVRGKPRTYIQEAINACYPEGRGMSIETIRVDLDEIKRRWIQSSLVDFNEAKARELAKWDALEAAYWDAWEHSLLDEQETIVEESDDQTPMDGDLYDIHRSKNRTITRGKEGNPAFLQGIERCLNARSKILGLFNAEQFTIDWREEARAFGWSKDEADNVKEQIVGVFMKSITTTKPKEPNVMIEGAFEE